MPLGCVFWCWKLLGGTYFSTQIERVWRKAFADADRAPESLLWNSPQSRLGLGAQWERECVLRGGRENPTARPGLNGNAAALETPRHTPEDPAGSADHWPLVKRCMVGRAQPGYSRQCVQDMRFIISSVQLCRSFAFLKFKWGYGKSWVWFPGNASTE